MFSKVPLDFIYKYTRCVYHKVYRLQYNACEHTFVKSRNGLRSMHFCTVKHICKMKYFTGVIYEAHKKFRNDSLFGVIRRYS